MSVRLPPHLFLTTYWEIIKLPPKHEATRQLLWLWEKMPIKRLKSSSSTMCQSRQGIAMLCCLAYSS